MENEYKEVLEGEDNCKLTELFARISETVHAKETKVLTDQTGSDAATQKVPRKSRRHSTLAQDIQLLTESLRRLLSLSDSLQHVQYILPHAAHYPADLS